MIILVLFARERKRNMKNRMSSQEWLLYIKDSIQANPSIIGTSQFEKEQQFQKLFYNGEQPLADKELQGVVLIEPEITNLFLTVLHNRVIRLGFVDALSVVNAFEVFKKEDLSEGVAWSKIMRDYSDPVDYNKTASPISITVHEPVEVFSDVPIRELVEDTVYYDFIKEAFSSADRGIQDIVNSLFKRARDTMNFRIYTEIEKIMKLDTTADANSNLLAPFVDIIIKKTADGYAIPVGSAVDGVIKLDDFGTNAMASAQSLKFFIAHLKNHMTKPTRKYNVGDANGKLLTSLPKGQGILILDTNALAGLQINDDSLFTKESSLGKQFEDVITVSDIGTVKKVLRTVDANGRPVLNANTGKPTEVITDVPTKTVLGLIVDPSVIEYKILLDKTLEFQNGKALYTNYWTHYHFATLSNPCVSAVRLILDTAN